MTFDDDDGGRGRKMWCVFFYLRGGERRVVEENLRACFFLVSEAVDEGEGCRQKGGVREREVAALGESVGHWMRREGDRQVEAGLGR